MNIADLPRYALLIALGIAAFLLVDAWNKDYGRRGVDESSAEAPISTEALAQGKESSRDVSGTEPPITAEPIPDTDSTAIESDIPDASLVQSSSGDPLSASTVIDDSRLIEVVTPVLQVWIDPVGGDIVGVKLTQFPASIDQPEIPTTLLDRDYDMFYIAQSGLVGRDGFSSSGEKPVFESRRDRWELDEGEMDVVLTAQRDGGDLAEDIHVSRGRLSHRRRSRSEQRPQRRI